MAARKTGETVKYFCFNKSTEFELSFIYYFYFIKEREKKNFLFFLDSLLKLGELLLGARAARNLKHIETDCLAQRSALADGDHVAETNISIKKQNNKKKLYYVCFDREIVDRERAACFCLKKKVQKIFNDLIIFLCFWRPSW